MCFGQMNKSAFSLCNQSNNNLKKHYCIDFYNVTQLKLLNVISLQKYDTKYYNTENDEQSISTQCG